MRIFEATLAAVRARPQVPRIGLVLRHSIRHPIETEEDVFSAGLTAEGIRQAEWFGRELGQIRRPGRLMASPVGRCIDSAAAIARGAGWEARIEPDVRLSHPFIERIINGPHIRWKRDPLPAPVAALLDLVLEGEDQPGKLDIFSTHDTNLAVLAGYFIGQTFSYTIDDPLPGGRTPGSAPASLTGHWPDFLEGILIFRVENDVHLCWREQEVVIGAWPVDHPRQLELGF